MFATLRHAMTWLHTWVGLVAGYLLSAIFFFGTLSVFDREIDRWAVPETRFPAQPMPSWSEVLAPAIERVRASFDRPGVTVRVESVGVFRTHRDPIVTLYPSVVAESPDGKREAVEVPPVTLDARTGVEIPKNAFPIGTQLFYPLHIHFHLGERAGGVGYWLVGLAAMGMLVALVSGVVIHRRLFAELFTFRPWTGAQRVTLDLHDVTGVLALPFHFMFAFTGLVVFHAIYLPVESAVLKPLAAAHARREPYPAEPARVSVPLASVDAMIRVAEGRWSGGAAPAGSLVGYLHVRFPGDANASVSAYRAGKDRATMNGEGIHFAGATGEVLAHDPPPSRVAAVVSFLTALHLQPFEQWTLRWLYVGGGLAGCVCLATGMIFFVRKRRRKQPTLARWSDAFATGAVTGPLFATLVLLAANRVLPRALPARVGVQEALFWGAWLVAFAHGAWRSGRAWREQCCAIAALALAAPVLNALTTGDHLGRSLATCPPVAGVDLVLLATAALAALAARRLRDA